MFESLPWFDQGMLALTAANNPQLGPSLDAMGLPMPGAQPAVGGWETTVNPAAPAAAGAQGNPLAGLQGIKAPAPIQPIMNGGVTGGVKAPEVNAKGTAQGAPAIQALMQALLQHQPAQTVPNLGSLVRGAV